ncbi:CRM-domain containing factor CFM2, chloroplastic isoform X2 [Actinidia eriantha]|uniref:CRM-domain containing factor CFM2, chloroplastic isoform X2 n=1 Tax=Actinidia eriantha TaxID=165200 RepID=UPI002588FBD3|nr:CRM-domain containing factor CFM2, chloroplastic isoform X2 [Actinidia eriantha]
MLLPLHNHHTSLPHKTLRNPSLPLSFFPSSLSKTIIPHPPKPLLLRPAAASDTPADHQTLPGSAIKRIADKLRSLGYADDDDEESKETLNPCPNNGTAGEIFIPLPKQLPKYRVGHTIDASWSTPENPVPEYREREKGERRAGVPTLAELTIPRKELRRLRAVGIEVKKKLKIGKAGITEGIVNGIHERWRSTELVKIVCEDIWRMNMKRTHELLERKTGGLVIWRSGSNIILYRGTNYKYPYFLSDTNSTNDTSAYTSTSSSIDCEVHFREEILSSSTDAVNSSITNSSNKMAQPRLIQGVGSPNRVRFQLPGEAQLAEEADRLLDGLGPRFTDWWGYDPLPVDADLLPAIVPGYRKPFRLLPYGVKSILTNDELTILKRLGGPLPCHFVLGRNRKLQGLAASIVKLWEKCEIAKIAVKRGVQNTRSELMAEELKLLTGGSLLSRDNDFIVFYRGKDFLPAAVSSAIEERRKFAVPIEKHRTGYSSLVMTRQESEHGMVSSKREDECDGIANPESNIVFEQMKLRSTETTIERTSNKLRMALDKKARADNLLAELEMEETSQESKIDKVGITEEERYMLRKVGLKMKPFLLLGRRGVFDGTVENMHLHWKYRELVKVICGGRRIEEVQRTAQTLEAESGGILVAVERVSKGYAIIVYRGKNYKRPACLRPQTLLTKRQAMKRSLEAQRRESLKLHVLKLSRNIDELKLQLAKDKDTGNLWSTKKLDFNLARERSGVDPGSFNSNDSIDASKGSPETSQHDMLRGFPALYKDEDDDFKITEPEPFSESELKETNAFIGVTGQGGDAQSATTCDDSTSQDPTYFLPVVDAEQPELHACDNMAITPVESPKSAMGISVCSAVENRNSACFPSLYKGEGGQGGDAPFATTCDDSMSQVPTSFLPVVDAEQPELHACDNMAMTPVESPKSGMSISVRSSVENISGGLPFRAARLSNRERLILRKQALKMKKLPLLAVGRSNIVTGVAKALKAHFQKHPLAIVNVKGRAKGTSVQEVVFNLEQETGAVLVSQEPCKVILYRGWGAEIETCRTVENNTKDVRISSASREGGVWPVISPELLSAIRLECGLKRPQEEEKASQAVTELGSTGFIA